MQKKDISEGREIPTVESITSWKTWVIDVIQKWLVIKTRNILENNNLNDKKTFFWWGKYSPWALVIGIDSEPEIPAEWLLCQFFYSKKNKSWCIDLTAKNPQHRLYRELWKNGITERPQWLMFENNILTPEVIATKSSTSNRGWAGYYYSIVEKDVNAHEVLLRYLKCKYGLEYTKRRHCLWSFWKKWISALLSDNTTIETKYDTNTWYNEVFWDTYIVNEWVSYNWVHYNYIEVDADYPGAIKFSPHGLPHSRME